MVVTPSQKFCFIFCKVYFSFVSEFNGVICIPDILQNSSGQLHCLLIINSCVYTFFIRPPTIPISFICYFVARKNWKCRCTTFIDAMFLSVCGLVFRIHDNAILFYYNSIFTKVMKLIHSYLLLCYNDNLRVFPFPYL